MNIKCIKCKGSNPQFYCGRIFCPILAKSNSMFKVSKELNQLGSTNFARESPAPFIGRFGYPHVNIGLLTPFKQVANSWEYDSPRYWANKDYKIPQIIDFRSELINSRTNTSVKYSNNKILDVVQEVGISSKPVDLELNLKSKPQFKLNLSQFMAPTGPNALLEKAKVTSNSKVSSKVYKVVDDTYLKANDAAKYLYEKGFDENFLSKILSVGTIGVKKNRKLVPTRWSITATDDNLGKHLIRQIKDYSVHEYCFYFGHYLGNYFLVLMFPEVWSYELFEMYLPKASFNLSNELQYTTDHEFYNGRSKYAENCGGGYYASRLPILERLRSSKRQSSVVVIRIITGEYASPLGVWVVREATRKAMLSKPRFFNSKKELLDFSVSFVKDKFDFDINPVLNKSVILTEMKNQSKLSQFYID